MSRLPLEFSDLVGFQSEEESFKALLSQKKLPPVLLFYGRESIGKSLFVAKLCALLLCEKNEACGLCESCLSLKQNKHRSVLFLNNEAPLISVEEALQVKRHLTTTPGSQKHPRLVFIRDVDRLSEQSTNKLLTVFEDLPPHTYVFLTTGKRYCLLKTLLSRSVAFLLKPPSNSDSLALLKNYFQFLKPQESFSNAICHGLEDQLLETRGAVGNVYKSLSKGIDIKETLPELFFTIMQSSNYGDIYEFVEKVKKDQSYSLEDILLAGHIALNRSYRKLILDNEPSSEALALLKAKKVSLKALQKNIIDRKIKLNKGLVLESLLN